MRNHSQWILVALCASLSGCADTVAPTIVSFEASATQLAQGDTVQFTWTVRDNKLGALTCSFDADGDGQPEQTTERCVGDGEYSFTYSDAGSFEATLKVTDRAGNVGSASRTLVSAEPVPLESGVHLLGPSDFPGGVAVFSFPDLAATESVAVIPVNADPDSALDALHYKLSVSGVAAASSSVAGSSPWIAAPADRARAGASGASNPDVLAESFRASDPFVRAHAQHLEHLERASDLVSELSAAGYQAGEGGGPDSARAAGALPQAGAYDSCVAPYATGKVCKFYLSISEDSSAPPIDAVLSYETANAYWFVHDADVAQFSQADFQALGASFEDTIVPSDNKYFGPFSDVDKNGKIFIVFSGTLWDAGVLGYVMPIDLYTDEDAYPATGVHSNEGDIFYATSPGPIVEGGYATREQYDSELLPATLAHELKHLISSGIRIPAGSESEELWIEEGSAQAAQELVGMGDSQYYAGPMLQDPQNFNVVYDGRPGGVAGSGIYGYNFLFVWRVAERVGHDNFWKPWTAGPGFGIENLEKHSGFTFEDIMQDWALTLLFDHTNLVSGFDYQSLSIRQGWDKLGYSPLKTAEGHARSMAYFAGKGNGQSASVGISTSSARPHFIIARFDGALPYSSSTRTGGDISGTLTGVGGLDLAGSYLFGCPVDDYCSYLSPVSGSGSSLPFVVPALPAGDYYVYVWKDSNSTGTIDDGDAFGLYTTDGENEAPVTAPRSGLAIDVYQY